MVKKVDVVSEGEMILKNTKIKVTEVKGNRIVVKPVKNINYLRRQT